MRFDKERKKGSERVWGVKDEEIEAPERFRARMGRLLRVNPEVLRQGTGSNQHGEDADRHHYQPPIKLKPYRTHIHKRPLLEKAFRDMLEPGMLDR